MRTSRKPRQAGVWPARVAAEYVKEVEDLTRHLHPFHDSTSNRHKKYMQLCVDAMERL